jgi:hypothetical protein
MRRVGKATGIEKKKLTDFGIIAHAGCIEIESPFWVNFNT